MAKYDPLRDYLMTQSSRVQKLVLSIPVINRMLKAPLPRTAKTEGVFWANVQKSRLTPQSAAWLNSGWLAHEDVANGRGIFTRITSRRRRRA